jgi:hypothetical protein
MNLKHLIAAVAALTAGSAFADNTYPYVDHSSFTGTRTRAQVIAELDEAGSVAFRHQEFVEHTQVASGKTRAEVRADLERLHAKGMDVARGTQEFVEFTNVASTRSRDEVREEAIAAGRGGAAGGTSSGS